MDGQMIDKAGRVENIDSMTKGERILTWLWKKIGRPIFITFFFEIIICGLFSKLRNRKKKETSGATGIKAVATKTAPSKTKKEKIGIRQRFKNAFSFIRFDIESPENRWGTTAKCMAMVAAVLLISVIERIPGLSSLAMKFSVSLNVFLVFPVLIFLSFALVSKKSERAAIEQYNKLERDVKDPTFLERTLEMMIMVLIRLGTEKSMRQVKKLCLQDIALILCAEEGLANGFDAITTATFSPQHYSNAWFAAAKNKQIDFLQHMLNKGKINKDVKNIDGNNIRHLAVIWKSDKLMEFAEEIGVNPNEENNKGQTAYQCLPENERKIVESLERTTEEEDVTPDTTEESTKEESLEKVVLEQGNTSEVTGCTSGHCHAKNQDYDVQDIKHVDDLVDGKCPICKSERTDKTTSEGTSLDEHHDETTSTS